VAPVFGPLLFRPLTRAVQRMADRLRPIQSGHMNLYLSLVGVLLLLALIAATL